MSDKKTREWIEKAKKKFGNEYDYSKVNYINSKTKIIIKCSKHNNEFEVTPYNHLKQKARGCNKCNKYNYKRDWASLANELRRRSLKSMLNLGENESLRL